MWTEYLYRYTIPWHGIKFIHIDSSGLFTLTNKFNCHRLTGDFRGRRQRFCCLVVLQSDQWPNRYRTRLPGECTLHRCQSSETLIRHRVPEIGLQQFQSAECAFSCTRCQTGAGCFQTVTGWSQARQAESKVCCLETFEDGMLSIARIHYWPPFPTPDP